MGIPSPPSVIGNTDDQVVQLLALANREGKEFYAQGQRNDGWEELHLEYSFATAGSGALTCDTVSGSAVITGLSTTTNIAVGYAVFCNSFPANARVVSVDSATQVTVSLNSTATVTATNISFGKEKFSMPSDFAYFIVQTFWDGNYRWQLLGPLDAQEKNVLKYGISPAGPRKRFWIMGNYMYLNPAPTTTGEYIYYDYYSNAWCQSASGTLQSIWTADTDYYNLDDEAFILGLKWRFLAAKGLNYAQEKQTYELQVQRLMSRNGGNRAIPLNAQTSGINLLNAGNVPDTGFGT